ncbi:uncharacterized protein LOC131395486 isoform X2 [Diceros bicornis minor]|uniref:uncharacterized protein LOC131395486 isoform X2 n=1 Tax=Diceros bicornis minor TaxID=77932 RepID=UPI0026EE67F5|nr:uncharacterized protein LOC131395486 isoform X2 [Diceros bicornis minor]
MPSPLSPRDWHGRQTAPRGVKGAGETRLGEAGGVERVRVLGVGREVGAQAGVRRGAWPPEPMAKAGLCGRRRSRDRCPCAWTGDEARSPVGVDVPPATEGRVPGGAQRDMTWSGVTARTDVTLSGLPEHSRLAPGALERPAGLCSFTFLKEPTHYCCSLDPKNPQNDKKWCYPAHAWALEPGLLQVLLALTREYAAFWNHYTT